MPSARLGYGLVIALYLLSFPYHPQLRSPNELCRLFAAQAIAEFGKLSINEVLQARGGVNDLSCTATIEVNGKDELFPCVGVALPAQPKAVHYYSSKAPLLSFLGAPVYWVLARFGPVTELGQVFFSRLFLTVVPALLLLAMLRRFLRAYVAEPLADLVVVTYGVGSMAFSYAEAFMSHQVTAVLAFAAFFAAWRTVRGEWKPWGWALAGLAAGSVVLAEYTGALTVVCIAGYVVASLWKQWRKLGVAVALVVAGAVLPIGALLAYHSACFGSPLTSGYKFLNDAQYQHWHVGGFLGIRTPDPQALFLSFFSPLRGLFTLSPFLLIAAWGLKPLRTKERSAFLFSLGLLGANAYFTSSFAYDSWGWTVGPRHLTPWLPFLLLPIALGLERLTERGTIGLSVALGACVSSIVASQLAAFIGYVPSDVSTSVFGLALPMLANGIWPVSWLAALGLTNPASGALLVLLALGCVVWVAWRAREMKALPVVLVLVIVVHLGVLKLFTSAGYCEMDQNPGHDAAAQSFLSGIWLGKNGERFRFFE